jgi:hypothetical protein
MREASCHDLRSVKEHAPELPTTTLLADSAYADGRFKSNLPRKAAPCARQRKNRKAKNSLRERSSTIAA